LEACSDRNGRGNLVRLFFSVCLSLLALATVAVGDPETSGSPMPTPTAHPTAFATPSYLPNPTPSATYTPAPSATPLVTLAATPAATPAPTVTPELGAHSTNSPLAAPVKSKRLSAEIFNAIQDLRSSNGVAAVRVNDSGGSGDKLKQRLELASRIGAVRKYSVSKAIAVIARIREILAKTSSPKRRTYLRAQQRRILRVLRVYGRGKGDASSGGVIAAAEEAPQLKVLGDVEVLATNLTYGQDGPVIPQRVRFVETPENSTESRSVPIYNDFDVEVGQIASDLDLGVEGSTIEFFARMAYPDFATSEVVREVGSASEQTIMLSNGDNLANILSAKQVALPFGNQESLESILVNYLDSNGDLVLDDNQVLYLYEVGTSNPNSAAYDFQDLVLLLTTRTVVVQEEIITLVNRIDPNGDEGSSASDGLGGTAMWWDGSDQSDWNRPATAIRTVPKTGFLEQIRMVVGGTALRDKYQTAVLADWLPGGYADTAEFVIEVFTGKVDDMTNTFFHNERWPAQPIADGPTIFTKNFTVQLWGTSGDYNTFLVTIDVSGDNIKLEAGEEYLISIGTVNGLRLIRNLGTRIEDPVGMDDAFEWSDERANFFSNFNSPYKQGSNHFLLRTVG